MTISNMAFSPTDGLNNVASFPTTPANEAAGRAQIQTPSDQLRDYINNTLIPSVAQKTQEAWITATLLNSWTGTAQYAKNDLNLVSLRLSITAGTITALTSILTLPTGYRPIERMVLPLVRQSSGQASGFTVYIHTDGGVRITADAVFAGSVAYGGLALFYAA